ncbi:MULTISPECIES: hypothetical protein [unclassified Mumia]|nr:MULTISPECIES: hypothetical protein [unclassified Mumia]
MTDPMLDDQSSTALLIREVHQPILADLGDRSRGTSTDRTLTA